MASDPQACIVSITDGISQFEVPFVNSVSRTITTQTLFLSEPVIYQPPHLAQPVLTHITFIGKEYFAVGASTTERMIPRSQTQKVVNFKLTLEEIEKEVYAGKALDAGERMIWKRLMNCCLRETLLGGWDEAMDSKEETILKPISEALARSPESKKLSPISTQGSVLREIDVPFPPRARRRQQFLLSWLLGCLLTSAMANH